MFLIIKNNKVINHLPSTKIMKSNINQNKSYDQTGIRQVFIKGISQRKLFRTFLTVFYCVGRSVIHFL